MLVNDQVISEEKVDSLILTIRKKKELQDINYDFILDQLFEFLKRDHKAVKYLTGKKFSARSDDYKQIVKQVRARLRRSHSLFREESVADDREELFNKLQTEPQLKKVEAISRLILETHSSTKERLDSYEKLYERIFKITGQPDSILDLGAGLNPLSITFMNFVNKRRKKDFFYLAYDINEQEINSLNLFFNKMKEFYPYLQTWAEILDLFHWDEIAKVPAIDICFFFKMSDVMDLGKGHKVTEAIVSKVPARYVVASFPTVTVGGKRMNYPRRKWIELMCERLGYPFKLVKIKNELFYVIKKERKVIK